MIQKILVIQTAFTGDVVLATAVVEKLHQFYPEAEIDFLLRKGNEGLLKDHPFIEQVLIWNKKEKKFKNLFGLLKEIRRKKYDKVINLQRFASTGFLTAFSRGNEKELDLTKILSVFFLPKKFLINLRKVFTKWKEITG